MRSPWAATFDALQHSITLSITLRRSLLLVQIIYSSISHCVNCLGPISLTIKTLARVASLLLRHICTTEFEPCH